MNNIINKIICFLVGHEYTIYKHIEIHEDYEHLETDYAICNRCDKFIEKNEVLKNY